MAGRRQAAKPQSAQPTCWPTHLLVQRRPFPKCTMALMSRMQRLGGPGSAPARRGGLAGARRATGTALPPPSLALGPPTGIPTVAQQSREIRDAVLKARHKPPQIACHCDATAHALRFWREAGCGAPVLLLKARAPLTRTHIRPCVHESVHAPHAPHAPHAHAPLAGSGTGSGFLKQLLERTRPRTAHASPRTPAHARLPMLSERPPWPQEHLNGGLLYLEGGGLVHRNGGDVHFRRAPGAHPTAR